MNRRVLYISHRSEIGGGELSLFSLIMEINKTNLIKPFIILGEKGALFDKFCDAGFIPAIISMPSIKKLNIISMIKIFFIRLLIESI